MCGVNPATGDTVGVAFDALWIADNAINQGVGSEFDNDVLAAFQWFADPDGNPNTVDDVPDVVQNSWGIDARFGGTYQDCDYRWQAVIEAQRRRVGDLQPGNEGPSARTHWSLANTCNTPTGFGRPHESANGPIPPLPEGGPSDRDA
jgi:hypothetical protein